MFASPSRRSPHKSNHLPEGPIQDFCSVIEGTPVDQWQTRTNALKTLVSLIPDRPLTGSPSRASEPTAWYDSPPILRHLALPFSELIKDPRSTVVKRSCEYLTDLMHRCQYDARYLVKDMMPAVMSAHAQTVQVIRNYVQTMTLQIIAMVPCKMAMPLWLDRLKSDKSRSVREACALYLGTALLEWSTRDENYLSRDIWIQVGTSLVHALRDQAPAARQNAKRGLETIQGRRPDVVRKLVDDARSTHDGRAQKMLARIQAGEVTSDDVSVVSGGSRSRIGGGQSVASMSSRRSTARQYSGVTSPTAAYIQGRTTMAASSASTSRALRKNNAFNSGSSQSRFPEDLPTDIAVMGGAKSPSQRTIAASPPSHSGNGSSHSRTMGRRAYSERATRTTAAALPTRPNALGLPVRLNNNGSGGYGREIPMPTMAPSRSYDSADGTDDGDAVLTALRIGNKFDLQEHAKKRNSRRSTLLKMRLASSRQMESTGTDNSSTGQNSNSDTLLDDLLEEDRLVKQSASESDMRGMVDSMDSLVVSSKRPEHHAIAHDLLEAHKSHVDTVMATLKIEMEALKEFELLYADNKHGRPSEDDVLDYFESVGLCLDQRTTAGMILKRSMDRISRGGGSSSNNNSSNGSIR